MVGWDDAGISGGREGVWKIGDCSDITYFARLANLPKGLYILPSVISFFFFFFILFNISRRLIISRSAGPIFAIFTSNESVLSVDDRSGPLF